MFGHHWENAEATIVLVTNKMTTGDGMVTIHEFVADVRVPGREAFRAEIQEPRIATYFKPPGQGQVVSVLVDAKRGKVKFDTDDPRLSLTAYRDAQKASQEARREAALHPSAQAPSAEANPSTDVASLMSAIASGDVSAMRASAESLRAAAAVQPPASLAANGEDPSVRLTKLAELRKQGLVTEAEYAAQRERILAGI